MLFPTKSPTLLLGPPGIGKTARIKAAFPYVMVIPTSGWSDEDLNGLPYRDEAIEKRTLPIWYTQLCEASEIYDRVALFFDEIDKTPISVANTLLTLIEARQHGNIVLPVNCAIVAAANSRGEISDALWERFSKILCEVDFPAVITFLGQKAISDPAKKFVEGLRSLTLPLVSLTVDVEAEQHRSMIPRTCELFIHACNEYPDDLIALVAYARGLFPNPEVTKILKIFTAIANPPTPKEADKDSREEMIENIHRKLNRTGAIRI